MKKPLKLILSLAAPVLIGAISGYATSKGIDSWYMGLKKPSFNPPNWIFGPVWTLLYLMIGFAFFQVWNKFGSIKKIPLAAKTIYSVQLFLNFTWSIVFFGMENPGLGLINIALLWGVIIGNITIFYKLKKSSGLILLPYLAWVSFASLLNFSIFVLN